MSLIKITNKKGKILLISWAVPPIMGSHGRRVIHFLKYLQEFGWELDVLTVSPSSNFPLFDSGSVKNLPNSVKIFRVYSGFFSKVYYNSTISSRCNFNNRKNRIFKEMFKKILEKLKIIIFGMSMYRLFDWSPFAIIKGVKLITRYNYDVLISSGLSDPHLIAYTIKKMKRKIPWIIDYGDPWVFESTYRDEHTKINFLIEHWLEQRILKSANVITVTTEETKKNYLVNYPFLEKENVKVIPMGVDYNVFKKIQAERSEKFRILYTGSIYPTRDIKPFLDAIKLLSEHKEMKENIEVLFVGNIEDKYKEFVIDIGLEDVMSFGGFVPYEKSLSLIMGADVLLSFGNKGGLQVPGKLFDYVGSKRPILWIKGDKRDPALHYIEGLNRAIIADNVSKDIHSKILMLYNLYKKQELEKNFDLEELPAFSWKDRVKILNELCEGLVDTNK
jgi:glycosyltransferase involved in cell wall biosynthesis